MSCTLIFTACAKGGSGNTSKQGFCAEMYFVCVDVRLAVPGAPSQEASLYQALKSLPGDNSFGSAV